MFSYIANNENYIYELNEDVDYFKKGFTYRILSQLKGSSAISSKESYRDNGAVYTIVGCASYDPNSYEQRKEFLHVLDYIEMVALIRASFLKQSDDVIESTSRKLCSVGGNRK